FIRFNFFIPMLPDLILDLAYAVIDGIQARGEKGIKLLKISLHTLVFFHRLTYANRARTFINAQS
uniref:hypothetical protein n=1 Tax=Okeania hirsuta TaxID=1458930 RepID=UPI000F9C8AE5